MVRRSLITLIFLIISASPVFGAEIFGTVYDLELNSLPDSIVEITTSPKQVFVAKNGTYSFSVPKGTYLISAHHNKQNLTASEKITVTEEGEYVLDLLLFPDLGEVEEILNETLGIDVEDVDIEPEKTFPWIWLVVILLGIGLLIIGYFMPKKKVQPEQEEPKREFKKPELTDLLEIIRKEGGRITQKDLRSQMPYSEAKISLMIAELEDQGKVKKIKKGRGNIIVLQ